MKTKHIWIVQDDLGFIVAQAETELQAVIRDAGLTGTMFDGFALLRAVEMQTREGMLRTRQVIEIRTDGEWYVG